MSIQDAVENFLNKRLEQLIKYEKSNNPDRLKKSLQENPDFFVNWKNRERIRVVELAKKIQTKDELCYLWRRGDFNNHNPCTKKMFEEITGIVLAKTNAKTNVIIREYLGINNKS